MIVMNLFAGREQRCRHREWTGKRRGEEDTDGGIDRHTLPCVKQIANWGDAVLYREFSSSVRGWGREGVGGRLVKRGYI